MKFFINLRGQELEIDAEMAGPDLDVGISSAYPDEWYAKDVSGQEVEWEWTEEEISAIEIAASDAYYDDMMECGE